MKRGALAAVVLGVVLVVGLAWVLLRPPGSPREAEPATGASGGLAARGGEGVGGAPLAARGSGGASAAVPGSAGRVGESGGSGTTGSGGAAGLRALKPRGGMVGEAVGSAGEGANVEVHAVAPPEDKLASLKPQRGAGPEQVAVVAQGGAEGELPPEVVFEGGQDKRFGTETQVQLENIGKIAGDAGTMAFWLKPDWQPSDQNDAVFVQVGEGQQAIRVAKNVNYLRFEFFDPEGRERGVGVPLDEWKPGEWHQVSATWVQGRLQLFVDGKPVSQNTFDVAPTLGEDPKAYVGSKLPSGTPAAGEMTDVRILNRPLQPSEIEALARSENRPR
ncbi:MAG: hypothetical protein KatS3mg077_1931 [Candidatus Binatia bacterium]|nr:MAG: hypothetical protein KatS3mg077_1931 [Candidatus Binatia bacterium]